MNPYPGHTGYPNGQPTIPGQQYPGGGGAAASSADAAAGGPGHTHLESGATRRWQRHGTLTPLGNLEGSSTGSSSGAGSSSSFGFDDDEGFGSWLPPTPSMMNRHQEYIRTLQQEQQQQRQQRQLQQHEGGQAGVMTQQQQQPAYWPHASVQQAQNPLKKSPPMRSPRWLKQYVANGGSGGGRVAPACTVGGVRHGSGGGGDGGGGH